MKGRVYGKPPLEAEAGSSSGPFEVKGGTFKVSQELHAKIKARDERLQTFLDRKQAVKRDHPSVTLKPHRSKAYG